MIVVRVLSLSLSLSGLFVPFVVMNEEQQGGSSGTGSRALCSVHHCSSSKQDETV